MSTPRGGPKSTMPHIGLIDQFPITNHSEFANTELRMSTPSSSNNQNGSPRVGFRHGPNGPAEPPPTTDSLDISLGANDYTSPATSPRGSSPGISPAGSPLANAPSPRPARHVDNDTDSDDDDGWPGSQAEEVDEESPMIGGRGSPGHDTDDNYMNTRGAPGTIINTPDFEPTCMKIGQAIVGPSKTFKIQKNAVAILKGVAECNMVQLFEMANMVANAGGRQKVEVSDLQAVRRIEQTMHMQMPVEHGLSDDDDDS